METKRLPCVVTWESPDGQLNARVKNYAEGAASVDATLFPLLNTLATVVVVPTSSTVSATNPSYTATCLVNQYSPFNNSVGDIATLSVTWPTSGTVVRGTA